MNGLFFNVSLYFIPETFKRPQSRVNSSGATINSWMNFCLFICLLFLFFYFILFLCIYLFIFSFLPFACFFCLFVLWLLILFLIFIGLFCSCVLLSLSFFPFWHGDFISLWVGLGLIFRWSENKISYLGAVYKFLNVGMDLAVLKNYYLFCIFNIQIYIFTNLL